MPFGVVAVTVPVVPAMFVPTLALPSRRVGAALYGMATMDSRGRLVEQAVLRGLGWSAGTPIDVRVWGGLVLVAALLAGPVADPSGGPALRPRRRHRGQ